MGKKRYKGIKGEGENLWSAILDEYNDGNSCNSIIEKWIDSEVEFSLSTENDSERIKRILWDNFNLKELNWFAEKGFDVDEMVPSGIDRNSIEKLLQTFSENSIEYKKIILLKEKFKKDFDGKRLESATEFAWEMFNNDTGIFHKKNTNEDKEVAEFFGIETEIIEYENCIGKWISVNDVVGFCHNYCQEPLQKIDLIVFNENVKKRIEDDDDTFDVVGICPECDERIYSEDITDEKIKMLVKL